MYGTPNNICLIISTWVRHVIIILKLSVDAQSEVIVGSMGLPLPSGFILRTVSGQTSYYNFQ